ncbi:unnamed protein product [Closterium sp. Naga37s-1]|nr:unnamed protein product [Closterium sp. Naga37s-1]
MIAFAMGPLSSRLQTLCLANATAAISRLSLRVVWLKDEGMIYVPPSEILLGGGGGASGGSAGGGSGRSRGKFSWGRREPKRGAGGEVTMAGERGGGGAKGGGRGGGPVVIDTGGALSPVTATRAFLAHPFVPKTMRFGQCGRSSAALDPSEAERLSLDVWVSVRALNRTNFVSGGGREDVMGAGGGSVWVGGEGLEPTVQGAKGLALDVWVSVRALTRTNFTRLQPPFPDLSPLFTSHILQEEVVGCLVLEEFHHATLACIPPPSLMPSLMLSHCFGILPTTGEGGGVFSVGGVSPLLRSPAALGDIADFFDPNRAPFMSPSAEFRAARCTEPAIKKLMATPGLMDPEPGLAAGPGGPKLPGTPGSEAQMGGATGVGGGGGGGGGGRGGGGEGGEVGGGGGAKGRQEYANVSVDELVAVIGMVAERGKEAVGVVEEAKRVDAGAVERARRVVIGCQQHEFAELLLLANTQAMLHMRPSPAGDFIRARALARNPSFRMLPPVCHTSPIPPIPRQLFAKFFVVEPSLNLACCSLPKVACTSWRMWLRAMLHLPLSTPQLPCTPQTHCPTQQLLSTSHIVGFPSWRMWLRAMLHLPKPEDHFLTHSYEGSGLGDLSQKLTEKEALQALSQLHPPSPPFTFPPCILLPILTVFTLQLLSI